MIFDFDTEFRPTPSFSDVVDSLRYYNLSRQAEHFAREHRACSGPFSYAKEFQTVRIDAGRQVGKTTYVTSRAVEGDLIVALNNMQAQMIMTNFDVACGVVSALSFNNIRKGEYSNITGTVWIDEPRYISPKQLDMVYEYFAGKVKQFVLLG